MSDPDTLVRRLRRYIADLPRGFVRSGANPSIDLSGNTPYIKMQLGIDLPITINLVPASSFPFETDPPKKPKIIVEKLLYILGIRLLINTSALPVIVFFIAINDGLWSFIFHFINI